MIHLTYDINRAFGMASCRRRRILFPLAKAASDQGPAT